MEKYKNVEGIRRKMYGEKGIKGDKGRENSVKRLHAAKETPKLVWHVKDGEAVTEQEIRHYTGGMSLEKYKEKDALKRRLPNHKIKDVIRPEKMEQEKETAECKTSGKRTAHDEDRREHGVSKQNVDVQQESKVWNHCAAERTPKIAPNISSDNVISTEIKIETNGKSMEGYKGTQNLKRKVIERKNDIKCEDGNQVHESQRKNTESRSEKGMKK